jgi:hypothetical protein
MIWEIPDTVANCLHVNGDILKHESNSQPAERRLWDCCPECSPVPGQLHTKGDPYKLESDWRLQFSKIDDTLNLLQRIPDVRGELESLLVNE